jgi:SAM-dependent methyltransferase
VVTRHVDWRRLPADLRGFDLVVASDVLYERPYAELVARTFAATMGPGGRGLVADPGRVAAGAFVEACEGLGLAAVVTGRHPWTSGAIRQTIDLYEVRRAG